MAVSTKSRTENDTLESIARLMVCKLLAGGTPPTGWDDEAYLDEFRAAVSRLQEAEAEFRQVGGDLFQQAPVRLQGAAREVRAARLALQVQTQELVEFYLGCWERNGVGVEGAWADFDSMSY